VLGTLVALNLQTSFLTPLYIKFVQIFKGCMRFLVMVFLSMALLYIFPSIAFWLPGQIHGR